MFPMRTIRHAHFLITEPIGLDLSSRLLTLPNNGAQVGTVFGPFLPYRNPLSAV